MQITLASSSSQTALEVWVFLGQALARDCSISLSEQMIDSSAQEYFLALSDLLLLIKM